MDFQYFPDLMKGKVTPDIFEVEPLTFYLSVDYNQPHNADKATEINVD